MSTYIITYDLNKETNRPPIVKEIKDFSSWAKLSESSYAISTNFTAQQVYEKLKHLIDNNDNLYVITLKKPYFGFGKKEVNDWLEQNLKP